MPDQNDALIETAKLARASLTEKKQERAKVAERLAAIEAQIAKLESVIEFCDPKKPAPAAKKTKRAKSAQDTSSQIYTVLLDVIKGSAKPLRYKDIERLVNEKAGKEVSANTISAYLHRGVTRKILGKSGGEYIYAGPQDNALPPGPGVTVHRLGE